MPANEIVDLDPGELFVHRNVANLAPPQDANYLSVLQFAVEVLKVKHIIVVGHYGCGGVAASVDGKRRGLVDHWLHPIRETYHKHRHALEAIEPLDRRMDRLCELNVMQQVRNVASDVFVQDAWAAVGGALRPRLGLFPRQRPDHRSRRDETGSCRPGHGRLIEGFGGLPRFHPAVRIWRAVSAPLQS